MLKKAKDFRSLLEAYNKDQPKKKSIVNLLNVMSGNKSGVDRGVFYDEMALEKSKSMNEEITKEIESFEKKKISSIQVIQIRSLNK